MESKVKVKVFSELISINTEGLFVGGKVFLEVLDDKVVRAYTKLSVVSDLSEEKKFWNKEYNEGGGLYCPNWELKERFKRIY